MHPKLLTRRTFAIASILSPLTALAQRRRRVVVTRNRVIVRPGHPIARAVNRSVVIRPARRVVTVGAPLIFLPAIAFTAAAVAISLPPRENLIWQDTESIERDEDWVESNFGVDQSGKALYLQIDGRTDLDFADITFANGQVQVVDFNERTYSDGLHRILEFPVRREVKTLRLIAKSKSGQTTFRLYLSN